VTRAPFNPKREKTLYKNWREWCLVDETVTGEPSCRPHWCEPLFDAKAAQLILYGRALGLGHGEAEDVLQEVFLQLLRRETPPEEPEHYCVRAYRNRAANYHRSLWRRLTREFESRRWFEREGGESPCERAAMRCLEQLPVEQREVIVLKIWHDHTFEEIGELLGVSPNTVAGRYRYGLQKIRHRLKGSACGPLESLGDRITLLDPAPPVG
jgi:RNA polymerase sigma-70 factor, ECF subfamily